MKPHMEAIQAGLEAGAVDLERLESRREFVIGGLSALWSFYDMQAQAEADQGTQITKAMNITQGDASNNYNQQSFLAANKTGIGAFVIWAPTWNEWEARRRNHNNKVWDSAVPNMNSTAGLTTYVAVPSKCPDWAVTAQNHAPKHRGPNSPWANYFRHILQEFSNANGFIFANEPNLEYYKDPNNAKHVAEMMVTASIVMKQLGYDDKLLLGPAVGDGVPGFGVAYMRRFIEELRYIGRPLEVPTALATHAYNAVKRNDVRGIRLMVELAKTAYLGDGRLYIPELGYQFKTYETSTRYRYAYTSSLPIQEIVQKHNMVSLFRKCQTIGNIALFANYTYQDGYWGGGGFMSGLVRYDGKPHPALAAWSRLPSAHP